MDNDLQTQARSALQTNDYELAKSLCEKLAKENNVFGLQKLGYLYQNGLGVPQNYGIAREYYENALAHGDQDPRTYLCLGFLYQNGLGVAADLKKARDFYEFAAKKGNVQAQTNLGIMYHCCRRFDLARKYYTEAAQAGSSLALNHLGYMLQHGQGIPVDYAGALNKYKESGKNEHALINQGYMYQHGLGVAKDISSALHFYQQATEKAIANLKDDQLGGRKRLLQTISALIPKNHHLVPTITSALSADFEQRRKMDESSWSIDEKDITMSHEELGKASYATVHKATLNKSTIAVKTLHNFYQKHDIIKFQAEAKLACTISHPNVLQMIGHCFAKNQICMKLEHSTLAKVLGQMETKHERFNLKEVVQIATDISFGMHYLHIGKIIHRDMNLGNFLISKDFTIKVSDFGLSRHLTQNIKQLTLCGAPWYMAPEVPTESYTFSVDIWSFGLLVVEICCNSENNLPSVPALQKKDVLNQLVGQLCPDDKDKATKLRDQEIPIFEALQRRNQGLELIHNDYPELFKLVHQCLSLSPENRPTFTEILADLHSLNASLGPDDTPHISNFVALWNDF